MSDPVPASRLFDLATLPARLVGRVHGAVRASIEEDRERFRGRGALLAALILVAVGYPVFASLMHATVGPQPEASQVEYALTPWITFVYAESLPFLFALVLVSSFSPALGILMLAVFAPADLVATALSKSPPNQLMPQATAIAARLLSYAILWLLVVEIPLRARAWAASSASGTDPSRRSIAVRRAIATTIFVGLWSYSLVWLIQPVINWTNLAGLLPLRMTAATIHFSWLVALAGGLFALLASLLARSTVVTEEPAADGPEAAPAGLVRQVLSVTVISLLLSGLMQDWLQAGLIVAGLLIAGPVLTILLPRIPVPARLAGLDRSVRWIAALVIAFGVTAVALAITPIGAIPDYLLVAILLLVVPPVFRLVVDAGTIAPAAPRTAAAVVATLLLRVVAVAALALAFPAVALADDVNETGTPQSNPIPTGALCGGAAAAAAAAAAAKRTPAPPSEPPEYGLGGSGGQDEDLEDLEIQR